MCQIEAEFGVAADAQGEFDYLAAKIVFADEFGDGIVIICIDMILRAFYGAEDRGLILGIFCGIEPDPVFHMGHFCIPPV